MSTETKKPAAAPQTPAVKERNITDDVLNRINEFRNTGTLKIPDDYSPENALKAAYLILQDVQDKDKKPALTVCSKTSIVNSLLKMIVMGLNPVKKQCYFIVRGTNLCCDVSYFGNIANAKRFGLKNIVPNVIFEKDEFVYAIDTTTGRKKVEKHIQSLDNIDINKIKGAYAVVEMADGTFDLEVMTITQIKQSWLKGSMKGDSDAHNKTPDEMAKRTVINRACKIIQNTSDDSNLVDNDDENTTHQQSLSTGANTEELTMSEAEVVESKTNGNEPVQDEKPIEQGNQEQGGQVKDGPGF